MFEWLFNTLDGSDIKDNREEYYKQYEILVKFAKLNGFDYEKEVDNQHKLFFGNI